MQLTHVHPEEPTFLGLLFQALGNDMAIISSQRGLSTGMPKPSGSSSSAETSGAIRGISWTCPILKPRLLLVLIRCGVGRGVPPCLLQRCKCFQSVFDVSRNILASLEIIGIWKCPF